MCALSVPKVAECWLNAWFRKHSGWSLHVALTILGVLASSLILGGQTPTTDRDPRIGTWTLNLDRSKFPAGTAPKLQVRRVESRPDGLTVFTLTGQDGRGHPMFIQTAYKFDGREYPEFTQTSLAELLSTGAKPSVMNTYKLIDAYTVEITRRDTAGTITGINTRHWPADDDWRLDVLRLWRARLSRIGRPVRVLHRRDEPDSISLIGDHGHQPESLTSRRAVHSAVAAAGIAASPRGRTNCTCVSKTVWVISLNRPTNSRV